ncbi:MAG: universal stress protein [Thiohalobacteraceae bacterium]
MRQPAEERHVKGIARILASTDFSEDGRHAARRAALLAVERHAELSLLHVMNGPSLEALRGLFPVPEDAERELAEESRRLLAELAVELGQDSGVTPDIQVRIGKVIDEIVAAAEQTDLLVLGARGSTSLRDLILGSTAERLLRKRREPSLVVRRPAQGSYRRVLVPVDLSAQSADALHMAMTIAPDAEYALFHAFEVPFEGRLWLAGVSAERLAAHREQARLAALHGLSELIGQVGGDRARVRPLVKAGEAALLILNEETESDADLIVIGKQNYSRVQEIFLGSTARHVLSSAKCDVLVM